MDDVTGLIWVCDNSWKIYRQLEDGSFEITDNETQYRDVAVRGGKAYAIRNSDNRLFRWDEKWSSWEQVEGYSRAIYQVDVAWNGSLVVRGTNNYIYFIDNDDDADWDVDRLLVASSLTSPVWTVKDGLWVNWSSTYYNWNF